MTKVSAVDRGTVAGLPMFAWQSGRQISKVLQTYLYDLLHGMEVVSTIDEVTNKSKAKILNATFGDGHGVAYKSNTTRVLHIKYYWSTWSSNSNYWSVLHGDLSGNVLSEFTSLNGLVVNGGWWLDLHPGWKHEVLGHHCKLHAQKPNHFFEKCCNKN